MKLRFKRGTTELEMEFPGDVPEDQKEVVQGLIEQFSTILQQTPEEPKQEQTPTKPTLTKQGPERRSKRGGKRTAFVSPALDKLIESKWLVGKTTGEIVAKLQQEGVVAASEGNVTAALVRKVPHKLAKVEREGVTLWTVHTTQGGTN